MVLAQKQIHRSMEQDRGPRNKPMHLESTNLGQRRQEYTMEEKKTLSSISGAKKTGQLHVKEWNLEHSVIPYKKKKKLKID